MGRKPTLTNEEVEQEIERLKKSEAVSLGKKKWRLEYRRRKYLYALRFYEKEGKALMAAGITSEKLDEMYAAFDDDPYFSDGEPC